MSERELLHTSDEYFEPIRPYIDEEVNVSHPINHQARGGGAGDYSLFLWRYI